MLHSSNKDPPPSEAKFKVIFERRLKHWAILQCYGRLINVNNTSITCCCNFSGCGKVYDKSPIKYLASFKKHLNSYHGIGSDTDIFDADFQPKLDGFSLIALAPPKEVVTRVLYTNAMLDLIADQRLPLSIVDSFTFRKLLQFHREAKDPKAVKHFSRAKITRELTNRVKLDKEKIIEILAKEPSVYLTLDTWTSPNGHIMLGITVHFSNSKWKLHDIMLALRKPIGGQDGKNLCRLVIKVLKEYNLLDKLFSITTDGAASMRKLCFYLYHYLKRLPNNQFIFPENHLVCFAHCLNTVTQTIMIKGFKSGPLKSNEHFTVIAHGNNLKSGQAILKRKVLFSFNIQFFY